MHRKPTRGIHIGSVSVGDGAPITVQSMTNTDTRDWKSTVGQITRLEELGCEIIRVAILDKEAIAQLPRIKKSIHIPLIADIHNDYRLAIGSIEAGADAIRINPGNIRLERGKNVVKVARERQVPIRIGVNSGSLQKDLLERHGHPTPEAIVESALAYIRFFEDQNFTLIKVALKSSDVLDTIAAYRLFSKKSDYPLHLGVTEAGLPVDSAVKSALGIGTLLQEGIGDTFRVSVTGDPLIEIQIAYGILRALNIRQRGVNLISCPTCGRTEVNLIDLVEKAHSALCNIKTPINVAIMGCPVNGPGEAKEADVGIACSRKGEGVLFKKGAMVEKGILESDLLSKLLREVEQITGESIHNQ